jgi:hypothetical protein
MQAHHLEIYLKLDHHKIRRHIKTKAVDYGRLGLRLAVQAAFIYGGLILGGFIAGAIGGMWLAQHFGSGFFLGALACLSGLGLGAAGGFYLAQMIVMGLIQDLLLSTGLHHGKLGLQAALKLLREKRDRQKAKAAAEAEHFP